MTHQYKYEYKYMTLAIQSRIAHTAIVRIIFLKMV